MYVVCKHFISVAMVSTLTSVYQVDLLTLSVVECLSLSWLLILCVCVDDLRVKGTERSFEEREGRPEPFDPGAESTMDRY